MEGFFIPTNEKNMNIFQELIGKSKEAEQFITFENTLKSEGTIRQNNVVIDGQKSHDYELLFKEDGILITFLDEEIIGIKVHFVPTPICKPFQREFVLGLSHISSENDIKKQFNFPKNLNQAPMRADNIYEYENVTVAFDAMTGEAKYAEIK